MLINITKELLSCTAEQVSKLVRMNVGQMFFYKSVNVRESTKKFSASKIGDT